MRPVTDLQRTVAPFEVISEYTPSGDQPKAIKELTAPPAEAEQAPQDARSRRAMFGLARKAEEIAP